MTNENMQASIAAPAGAAADEPAQPAEEPSSSTAAAAAEPTLVERVRRLFRFGKVASLREDLADALSDVDTDSASFSPSERAMLHNILRLRETRVEDVMVPRADVEAIEESITLGELLDLFEKSGHSRMPVYCDTLDDPRGMIHIRDVVAHITRAARAGRRGRTRPAKAAEKPAGLNFAEVDLTRPIRELSLTRPVLFVPPSMLAADLMSRMQASRTQMALVIDEYGGTDGLVSLEDLVELVVGDIEDEHDDDEALITQVADGVFVVDARAEIEEVAELIGDSFNPGEHIEEVDTIGGMIFNVLGRIPARGEVVQAVPGYEFHVLEADPRRIRKVRIVRGRLPDRRRRPARSASE